MKITETKYYENGDRLINYAKIFFRWWFKELWDMLPSAIIFKNSSNKSQPLVISYDSDQLYLTHGFDKNSPKLAVFNLEGHGQISEFKKSLDHACTSMSKQLKIILSISRHSVIQKIITFPKEVTKNIDNVIEYELDRHTPFNVNQVYFDYRVLPTDGSAGNIKVGVVLVSKGYLDPVLKLIDQLNYRLSEIRVKDLDVIGQSSINSDGNYVHYNLLPKKYAVTEKSLKYLEPMLWVLVLALSLVLFRNNLVQLELGIDNLESELVELRKESNKTNEIRNKYQLYGESIKAVLHKKNINPGVLDTLNTITKVLPDDTWLESMEIKKNKLYLQGQSGAASQLIKILESAEGLNNPKFLSSVIQNPTDKNERFSISVNIDRGEPID